MEQINNRFEIGRDTYGHGVRVLENTQNFNTPSDSWCQMAEEEILDALIYMAADILRKQYKDTSNRTNQTYDMTLYNEDHPDDNELICNILMTKDKYPVIDMLWKCHEMIKKTDN